MTLENETCPAFARLFPSAHGQLLNGVRQSIRTHPELADMWAEWPGSTGLSLCSLESRPWSSATFNGERHKLEFRLQAPVDAPDFHKNGLDAVIRHLDDIELPLSGHALIDFHFADAETHVCGPAAAECRIRFEALTLADPPLD